MWGHGYDGVFVLLTPFSWFIDQFASYNTLYGSLGTLLIAFVVEFHQFHFINGLNSFASTVRRRMLKNNHHHETPLTLNPDPFAVAAFAEPRLGKWKTIDDEANRIKSVVESPSGMGRYTAGSLGCSGCQKEDQTPLR